MTVENKIENPIASLGGKASAEKLTPEERKERARRAAEARWEREGKAIPRTTHEGELHIGEVAIPCFVLDNGTKVISQRGMSTALGRFVTGSGTSKAEKSKPKDSVAKLPSFLSAKNLKPFVSEELSASLIDPIEFRPKQGRSAYGFKAELVPQICAVWSTAKDAGVLWKKQIRTAEIANILLRGLAHTGIIALVDEATGYQEVRDRLALQAILDRYLRQEFAAWAKRFPDEFYKEIFRLRGWKWQGMKVNRPQCVANYTKNLVYRRLAPGILKELETRNPKDDRGNRVAKHHQWLTEDVGHPALAQHLYAIIGLMRVADSWSHLLRMADRAFPKRGHSIQLDLFSEEGFSLPTAPERPS